MSTPKVRFLTPFRLVATDAEQSAYQFKYFAEYFLDWAWTFLCEPVLNRSVHGLEMRLGLLSIVCRLRWGELRALSGSNRLEYAAGG
jgi:hypothetical protein